MTLLSKACLLALASSAAAFAPTLRSPLPSRAHPRASAAVSLRMGDCPLTPLGANVILEMEAQGSDEQMTASGIMIAASVKTEGPKTGVIRAVGDGWHTESGTKIPIDAVAVGDKVMFREPTSFESRKMKTKEGEYYVLSVNDILAKIADE